jgi:hypothetical protein
LTEGNICSSLAVSLLIAPDAGQKGMLVTKQISYGHYRESLFSVLDEAFESVNSMFLDKGTSLFQTLATIDADTASKPVAEGCSSIVAQVYHTNVYVQLMIDLAKGGEPGQVDWDATWRVTNATSEEWDAIRAGLRETYAELKEVLGKDETFDNQYAVAGSMMILAHTVYHLGEIRRSLCMLGN